jgi:hypothetical protein
MEVTGAMDPTASPVSDATQYIRVSGVKRLSRGCAATNKAAAAGAGGAGKTGGIGAYGAATIAVIGGVAAAAVIGGLAAAGSLSSGSSVSR